MNISKENIKLDFGYEEKESKKDVKKSERY